MATALIHDEGTCRKCNCRYPLDAEHFRKRTNGSLELVCRSCWREYCKAYYEKNRDRMLAGFKAARAANPEFHRARDRRYFIENREAKRESKKRDWAKADKAARRRKVEEWKAANPDKARAIEVRRNARIRNTPELKAKAAARMRRWVQNNPEAAAALRQNRRSRELGAEGEHTRQNIHAILRLQGRKCYYCGVHLARFDVDHFIPLSRGGTNYPDNLVVCCGSCNSSKGARLPWEWRPERFPEGCTPR